MAPSRENAGVERPWIVSGVAQEALAFAAAAPDQDALRLGPLLERRFGLSAEQRATVLTQRELRARAAARWGTGVEHLLFTRDGLEQATRPALAQWRAERLHSFGVEAIADLGCGLGFESLAFRAAGLRVQAVELDATVAALAEANLGGLPVTIGDVTEESVLAAALTGVDAAFVDPARRDPAAPRNINGLTGHRLSDPESWSPPWSWVTALAARLPRSVAKVAPGIDHALIPSGGSAVWAAVDGDLLEASVWFPGFADLPHRAALAIDGDAQALLDSDQPHDDTIRAIGSYLLDVSPVVTRSGLVTTLAAAVQAARIDAHIGYLTCDATPAPSPFHRSYRVLEVMPFDAKRIGSALRAQGGGAITVMKRGFAADTEHLARQWRKECNGDRALVVALTRLGSAPTAILCG